MTNTLKLKALLIEKGLKQKDLAICLNLSKQSINMKLNNIREFKPSEINKLCNFLQIKNIQDRMLIFFANTVDCSLQDV